MNTRPKQQHQQHPTTPTTTQAFSHKNALLASAEPQRVTMDVPRIHSRSAAEAPTTPLTVCHKRMSIAYDLAEALHNSSGNKPSTCDTRVVEVAQNDALRGQNTVTRGRRRARSSALSSAMSPPPGSGQVQLRSLGRRVPSSGTGRGASCSPLSMSQSCKWLKRLHLLCLFG